MIDIANDEKYQPIRVAVAGVIRAYTQIDKVRPSYIGFSGGVDNPSYGAMMREVERKYADAKNRLYQLIADEIEDRRPVITNTMLRAALDRFVETSRMNDAEVRTIRATGFVSMRAALTAAFAEVGTPVLIDPSVTQVDRLADDQSVREAIYSFGFAFMARTAAQVMPGRHAHLNGRPYREVVGEAIDRENAAMTLAIDEIITRAIEQQNSVDDDVAEVATESAAPSPDSASPSDYDVGVQAVVIDMKRVRDAIEADMKRVPSPGLDMPSEWHRGAGFVLRRFTDLIAILEEGK